MKNKILYIIGNGFDLHHGMKSRYWDFRKYLEEKDPDLLENLEKYFSNDALWSNLEETLAYLDTEDIVEECEIFLQSYGTAEWKDSYYHDYQYEVQKKIDIITEQLKNRFTEWIFQLELPQEANTRKISLQPGGLFINFNYTDTLERLYAAPAKDILYIHNKAINETSVLILGHSRKQKAKKKANPDPENDDTDFRVEEANAILDKYFRDTYKSTGKIIRDNQQFFKGLGDIKEIYILGHSLSKVDIMYFKKIIKNIKKHKVKWKVSAFDKKELDHHKAVMRSLKIDPTLVEYDSMKNIDSLQLKIFQQEKL